MPDQPRRLWIFAVQSYSAISSFDSGETQVDFDQEPVIVGHQYAGNREDAKRQMAEELLDDYIDSEVERPDFWTDDSEAYEKLDREQQQAVDKWDNEVERIADQLQFFELIVGGEHATMFLN